MLGAEERGAGDTGGWSGEPCSVGVRRGDPRVGERASGTGGEGIDGNGEVREGAAAEWLRTAFAASLRGCVGAKF